jgi:hypothetical protein
MLAEHFHWTYDEVQEAPDWFVQRAHLWMRVKADYQRRNQR